MASSCAEWDYCPRDMNCYTVAGPFSQDHMPECLPTANHFDIPWCCEDFRCEENTWCPAAWMPICMTEELDWDTNSYEECMRPDNWFADCCHGMTCTNPDTWCPPADSCCYDPSD